MGGAANGRPRKIVMAESVAGTPETRPFSVRTGCLISAVAGTENTKVIRRQ
jgi:hypothetical protein